jgi:N-acetylmuramoyl-L-alanine amidase
MKFLYLLLLTPLLALLPLRKKATQPVTPTFNETLTSDTTSKGTISDDNKEYRIKKVVIDAGHGGHDSGCESRHYMEKTNTLAIALKLGQKMKDNFPNIELIYTRDKDEFIDLYKRAEIANRAKADLFISIHCNSSEGGQPLGTETYVLGNHKMEENLNVAKRENASILLENNYEKKYDGFDPNSNEAYIMFSLFQNAYIDKSILFAKCVDESLKNNAGRRSYGVKQAGFIVLHQSTMPSVLIETGFLNHLTEGVFISSEGGQETIAESILLAFKKYKKAVETKEAEPVFVSNVKFAPQSGSNESDNDLSQNGREGVIFKIQLATSSKDMSQTTRWKNVENLEIIKDNTVFKYFKTGIDSYDEAVTTLKKMKTSGFGDAFIVAYRQGKRISLDEAK